MSSYLLRNYDKRPSKKFPEKPKKQELDMGLRYEMIREAVEKIQPKTDRWQ